jgi:hypothetical protein
MSPELTQYVAYVAGMFLTPAIGFAVLGLFWGVRTLKEIVWP